ncbi:MAG: hypothetical protein RR623_10255 [Bacilli bacterium]
MAFGHFMNMEKLSLSIVENHIIHMTDNNFEPDEDLKALDIEKLINNISNGFVIITQLNCFFESFLNSILNMCMKYQGEILLKCSVKEKLDLIFMHYEKDLSSIYNSHLWGFVNKTTKIRNEMIHYKKSFLCNSTAIPDFKLGGSYVGEFFTQKNMKEMIGYHKQLANLIAETLGLKTNKKINIFECDGKDGNVSYVYDEKQFYIYVPESNK